MLHVCLSFLVLLLFVHLFLLFVFRPIGENSFCQRDIVIFLLRPPSRKESHDDASGSCVAKIERAAYNSARFIYFLLAEFYTHPLSLFTSSLFSLSLSLFLFLDSLPRKVITLFDGILCNRYLPFLCSRSEFLISISQGICILL